MKVGSREFNCSLRTQRSLRLVRLNRFRVGFEIRFCDDAFVVAAQESFQAVSIHDVLARHVGNRVGWNRADIAIPQELQYLAHAPLAGDTD